MKHIFKPLILVLLALLPTTTLAHDFEVDGIYYNINGTEATVTYRGTSYTEYSNEYTGNVTIPKTVTYGGTTYSVTAISAWAFYGCSGLTSITIPNSVTTIGYYAFQGTTWYNNQPDGLVYAGLVAYKYKGSMPEGTNIILRDGTLGIAMGAFSGCSGLTSIDIPNSVITIGDWAFEFCYGLTSVNIPNSVTSIRYAAFSGCTGLTSITIPNSVKTIGGAAFSGCSGLMSISIPNSVTTIGRFAFDGTAWYDNQPDGMVYVGLVAYCYKGDMPEGTSVILRDGTLGIAGGAFMECNGLTSVTIPNSVTTIGGGAFSGCSRMASVTIGSSVTSIGSGAFANCSRLTSITIPNSVTTIEYAAFLGCRGLTSVTIGSSVTSIGSSAFESCTRLASITIPNSVTSIGEGAFWNCSALTSVTCLATTPPTINSNPYAFPSVVTSQATLYVPRGSVAAYQSASNWQDFYQIVGLPKINDFEVDGVWYRALDESTAMVISKPGEDDLYSGDVVIPEEVIYEDYTFSVTAIDEGAFEDCYELNSVVIGDAVESIGENAFQGCTDLTSVTIGSGVTTIGAKAFNYCNALQTVTCRGTVPPVMASSNCFTNATYNRATLIVPRQYIETYAAADYWYKFSSIEGWGSAGLGDANGDGYITISDVTAIINILLTDIGIDNPDADLNHNGVIDIGDVTTLIHFLLTQ